MKERIKNFNVIPRWNSIPLLYTRGRHDVPLQIWSEKKRAFPTISLQTFWSLKKVPVPTKMMEKCSQERTPWTNFGTAFKRRKEFAECDPFLKRASKKRENGIFILRAALESGWTIKVRRNISMKLQHFARWSYVQWGHQGCFTILALVTWWRKVPPLKVAAGKKGSLTRSCSLACSKKFPTLSMYQKSQAGGSEG